MEDNKSATHQGQGLAGKAGEFLIGNDLRVTRLGFGSMRITGNRIWGEPPDRAVSLMQQVQRLVMLLVVLTKRHLQFYLVTDWYAILTNQWNTGLQSP
jgi:hypothetical protein